MRVPDIADFVRLHTPRFNDDEGVRVGDPNAEVTGVLVCWMATVDALQKARQERCSLVICHEDPYLPYEGVFGFRQTALTWSANWARIKQTTAGEITILRLHASMDKWLVYDAFRERLGLPDEGEGFERVFTMKPATVSDWIERTKTATELDRVRFLGEPDRVISRVGLIWGGLGLFVNADFIESVIRNGAELLVGGETDEYALRYMTDAGVAFIEGGHSTSENPGMEKFAAILQDAYPDLKVVYHRNPVPYDWR